MSFKGQTVKRKKINIPGLGLAELITTTYPLVPDRRKVIWWMGDGGITELGELITYYIAEPRKNGREKIKWSELFYAVKLNQNADVSNFVDEYFLESDIEEKDTYPFEELDEANRFIEEIKCIHLSSGGITVGSRAKFKRWVKVIETVNKKGKAQ